MEKKLPEGWAWKRLGELGKIESGGTPRRGKQEYWKGGSIPWVKISDISDKHILKTSEKITEEGLENSSAKMFSKGSLLISIFATLGDVGILNIDAACNQALASIQLNNNNVDRDYLYYLLKSLKKHFEKIGRGVAQNNINLTILKSTKIPLPPLETQRKIVAILEKADETKRLRMQADGLTTQLLQSVFLEMFGDPVKNPKRFDFAQLKTVYSKEKPGTKCGPFGSALKKHEYVRHGIPVLTMDAICDNKFINKHDLFITKEKYEQLTPYLVEKGDIIISRAGTVGKMCVANPSVCPSIIGTNLIRLSLNFSKIEPIYFTSLMTYCKGRVGRLKSGSDGAYTFMNTGILNNLDIPLPPLALQQKFAQIVEKVEAMRQNQKQSQQEIDNLFNALMQKAFKGELVA